MAESRSDDYRDTHESFDAAQDLDFEWVRRLRDIGAELNPRPAARAEARAAFLADIAEELRHRGTATR